MCERLLPRHSASAGGWLCLLLPAALVTSYLHAQPECGATDAVHRLLIAAAIGMCLRTLTFLLTSYVKAATSIQFILNHLLPGIVSSLCVDRSWPFALPTGLLITSIYHFVYVKVFRGLPRTFTFGEAAIMVQGVLLFVLNAICRLWTLPSTDFNQLNAIMTSALLCLLLVCVALHLVRFLRKPLPFYMLMVLLLLAVTCAPVTRPLPLIALLEFLLKDPLRLLIILSDLLLVAVTCGAVSWQLKSSTRASTRVRKVFHLLILLVFVPGLIYQCTLLYLATGVALAIFVVLELLRLLQISPFAATLTQAFDSFKDEKDAGGLALTPFCLLIGCALPIWLTPCPCLRVGKDSQLLLLLLSGILTVGVGDTAASVLGSKYGRNKWRNSNRSLEGTVAFVLSILLSVGLLQLSGVLVMTQAKWFATIFATLNAALVEALTDQVDNLVLPLIFYIIVGLA
ncbi:PREDICTED: dolichol kinase isoform X1 [Drosophila arizonae]|uniref:dolichol kinase n=1 Tax=Drosophila arizonae TaxID=7263 RepID=A0ABM1PEX2_DROAR|nr:PREDICTED: dolichol kinase isoform X1 [Drosophila arizonae]